MIEARGLTKSFEANVALRGVDLDVGAGELFALIGPDGAGKTTFFRLVAVSSPRPRGPSAGNPGATFGLVPQRFSLYEDLTVDENLDLRASLYSVPAAEARGRASGLLDRVGMGPFGGRLARRSLGRHEAEARARRRAPHAAAPPPPRRTDHRGRPCLEARVLARPQPAPPRGLTIVVSTPYMDEAEYATRLGFLDRGRLLAVGTRDEIVGAYPRPLLEVLSSDRASLRSGSRASPPSTTSPSSGPASTSGARRGRARTSSRPSGSASPASWPPTGSGPSPPRWRTSSSWPATTTRRPRESRPLSASSPSSGGFPQGRGPRQEVRRLRRRERRRLRHPPRQGLRLPRAERLGEVDDDQDARGPPEPDRWIRPRIRRAGRRPADLWKTRLGYMSQKFSLYLDLTVEENLRFFGTVYGLGSSKLDGRVRALADRLRFTRLLGTLTDSLSTGMRQRVALAAALLHEPLLLFLDEPTGGVDPKGRRLFWELIYELAAEEGMTVLVTTHYMDEAEQCDELAFILNGELIAHGPPPSLKRAPLGPPPRGGPPGCALLRPSRRCAARSRSRTPTSSASGCASSPARNGAQAAALVAPFGSTVHAEPSLEDVFVDLARDYAARKKVTT